jgi:hypothetical protein
MAVVEKSILPSESEKVNSKINEYMKKKEEKIIKEDINKKNVAEKMELIFHIETMKIVDFNKIASYELLMSQEFDFEKLERFEGIRLHKSGKPSFDDIEVVQKVIFNYEKNYLVCVNPDLLPDSIKCNETYDLMIVRFLQTYNNIFRDVGSPKDDHEYFVAIPSPIKIEYKNEWHKLLEIIKEKNLLKV